MLLTILFLLVSVNSFFVHALECMGRKNAGHLTSLASGPCKIEFGFHEHIPNDAELKDAHNCDIIDVDSIVLSFGSVRSCYASILIDYENELITVRLTYYGVNNLFSPTSDMIIFHNGATSVVRYEIDGLLGSQQVAMLTKIQCTTGHNCALTQLRTMFSTLLETKTRLDVFKEINHLLNEPQPVSPSNLT